MAYIKEYWDNKTSRAKQAKQHTEEMDKQFSDRIEESIRNTILYSPEFQNKKYKGDKNTEIILENLDSVSAVIKYSNTMKNGRIAVLNFASYKNPGGMFLNGSCAQEECLCHDSFLYNVLSQFPEYYEWNNNHKNKALYLNRALYTPDILFMKKNDDLKAKTMKFCDVITCAAPNKSAAQKYQNVSDDENTEVLKSRIRFVLDVAKDNHVDTLILGAFGCGVFGQDAKEVARIFMEYLKTTHQCFSKVVFAVPGKDKNYEAFQAELQNL